MFGHNSCGHSGGGMDMLWLIILLCGCGGNGFNSFGSFGKGGDCCDLIMFLLLMNCICGNRDTCCK